VEIPSALNSGIQGLQNARTAADQAATDIVASTTLNTDQQSNPDNNEVNTEVSDSSNNLDLPDLNQAIVNLKVAEFQAKASTEVIRSADDSLGTLLDVTA
jgi:hypothetical protein